MLPLLLALSTLPSVAQADAPTITLTGPSCSTCRIVRHVVVEFGSDPAAQDAAPNGLMAAIAVGNAFLGIVQALNAVPVVFGADGKVIRVLGRSGQGPGEFAGPGLVSTWRGDSILIADPAAGRMSVFDRQWKFGRTFPFPPVETWVPLNNGLVVAGGYHDPRSRDMLRILDASGKQLGTFGPPTEADSLAGSMGTPLLTTDGRTVWSVPFFGTYRISEWDPSTRRRVRILFRKGVGFLEKQEFAVADRQWARGLAQADIPTHTG